MHVGSVSGNGRKLMTVPTDSSGRQERQRNPRGEGARLRLEILDATQELLADGETVTLRSIARRAGIAAPSIYRHFADVDAIMTTIAEQAFEELAAVLVRQRQQEDVAVNRLSAVCGAYLNFAHEKPRLYRLMFGGVWNAADALAAHPEDDRRFRELGMNAYEVFVDAIGDCVRDGVSNSVDPHQDATALWIALHGLAQLRETTPLFPWPPEIDRVLVTQLARLRPGSTS